MRDTLETLLVLSLKNEMIDCDVNKAITEHG